MTKNKSKPIAFLLAGLLWVSFVQAQESANASGGNATGSGGSASYSVGQVVYTTNTGASGSVTQGVQHVYEISVTTGIEKAQGISLTISAYPNPTTDYLQLNVESKKFKDLSFQLYDMQGKLLQNEKITANQTSIVMSNFVPATYFVKVVQVNKEVKTFKIIKN